MNEQRMRDILSGREGGMAAGLLRGALMGLAGPYRAAVGLRNATFDARLRRPRRLQRPVISVGNITTGGTGKTPMVIEVARRLMRLSAKPAVLLRGYKSAAGRSDEQVMLAEALGSGVPVVADADRSRGARAALRQNPEVDVFVLDDGFQHRQVHREVDLVLVDATQPFGFGHVLPRGLLREPPGALARADGVIITRADQVADETLMRLHQRIEQISGRSPIARTAHQWLHLCDARGQTHALESMREQNVVVVCGIGNPQSFVTTARRFAGCVIAEHILPDHHAYTRAQLETLMTQAQQRGAQALWMTEKDWVKCLPLLNGLAATLPIYHPRIRLQFLDGESAMDALLQGAMI